MTISSRAPSVTVASGLAAERAAARIWAGATALRDALPEVATVEDKLPGIQQALCGEGASLHLASSGRHQAGFAIVVPRGEVAEIRYLATDPWHWGGGIATALLHHARAHALETGCREMELWVIADNERATSVYERAGWTATADVEVRHAGAGSSGATCAAQARRAAREGPQALPGEAAQRVYRYRNAPVKEDRCTSALLPTHR